MPSTRLFVAVAILVVVLLTAAWLAADIQAAQMQRWLATGHLPPIGNPWKGTSTPDFNYYLTINAIFVSIVLLIPAIGAFVLRRPGGAGPFWLMFWTGAWLAFVVHLWYGVDQRSGRRRARVPRYRVAAARHQSGRRHRHLAVVDARCGAGLVGRVPLGVDVVLDSHRARRAARRDLLLGAGVLDRAVEQQPCAHRRRRAAAEHARLRALPLVVYPFDPTSAAGRLYTLIFQAINRVVPWYRPFDLGGGVQSRRVARGAARAQPAQHLDRSRSRNPAGLAALPPFDPRDLVRAQPRRLLQRPDQAGDGQLERSRADRRQTACISPRAIRAPASAATCR